MRFSEVKSEILWVDTRTYLMMFVVLLFLIKFCFLIRDLRHLFLQSCLEMRRIVLYIFWRVWVYIFGEVRSMRRRSRAQFCARSGNRQIGVKKPIWVERTVLLMFEHTNLSHRKLADLFNQRYLARNGMSVGRTWVRELLKRRAYEALHAQKEWKHRIPLPVPCNQTWGVDTTELCDKKGIRHIVLGIIDYGSRMNIALRRVKRFNTWTLLGCLFLAFGEFGKPVSIKSDNHPVFRARRVRELLRRFGVRWQLSEPAKPWQNGYIERFFGNFKQSLASFALQDAARLIKSLDQFRFWYNLARPHQHLNGLTPWQVWNRVDPYRTVCKSATYFSAWNGRLRGSVMRH